ncbi:hypothetical protein N7457_005868 [Penicillium paradoxum]|uniref:uncharacterized protein n=1 Tax=Penicillium paradoxum TaxID=176176 RepID=UPI00254899F7|nr:uncharacterized protein N7457_005868 [Penicillium paradoxum]KAJ5780708.1 hypothetical protein N7457_005868 [Penicillium paradoxum]
MCNATPCTAPIEHARAKREAELKCPKKSSHGRLYPRHHNPNGFLPIAPRPTPSSSVSGPSGAAKAKSGSASKSGHSTASPRPSRSISSASSGKTPYPDAGGSGRAAALFDPAYSLLPSSSEQMAQTLPMVSPLEGGNPFEFPLDTSLDLDAGLGYLDDVDLNLDLELPVEEMFHVEDWSRYMWSVETGFEHLDTGYPPVSQ